MQIHFQGKKRINRYINDDLEYSSDDSDEESPDKKLIDV